jgi:OOP family OmpA-OmpF porin
MRSRKISSWLVGSLMGVAAIAAATGAAAQGAPASVGTTGFAVQRFSPAFTGDRFFSVSSPYASGDPGLHVSLLMDYASNPLLVSRVKANTDPTEVVTDQLYLHVNATFAIFDRLALNVDIPGAVLNDGKDPAYRGTNFLSPHAAAFGDLRIGLRGRIFGEQKDAFQVGLQGFLWAPTGSRADFTSDEEVRGMPQLLLGGASDRFVWSFNAGAMFRPKTVFNNVTIGHSMEFGGGVAMRLGDDRQVQIGPEFTVGIGLEDTARRNTHAEILLGAKYRIVRDVELGFAAGPGVTPGYGTPDARVIGSIAYTPDRYPPAAPPADADKDGVTDDKDQCPQVAQGPTPDPKKAGCPAPADKDKDGIADDADACIDVPGVASADPTKNGCPADTDGDGILDAQDKCPDTPQGPVADPLNPGCPAPPDADGDGIFDRDDACVQVKGLPNADKMQNGCPGDSDGDSIRDDLDACPEIRGMKDEDPKKNGCPKIVRFVGNEIVILQQVQFQTGTAKLTGNSDEILEEVASVLKQRTEVTKLEVQGHTDNKGNKNANKTLSQSRADSVMKALVAKGVEAERLQAKGFGQEVPIADNATDEGRQKNRRVQFKILEKKSKK